MQSVTVMAAEPAEQDLADAYAQESVEEEVFEEEALDAVETEVTQYEEAEEIVEEDEASDAVEEAAAESEDADAPVVEEDTDDSEAKVQIFHTLIADELTVGEKTGSQKSADEYFTVNYGTGAAVVEADKVVVPDGKITVDGKEDAEIEAALKLGGTATKTAASIAFELKENDNMISVYTTSALDGTELAVYSDADEKVASFAVEKDKFTQTALRVKAAGKYYLGFSAGDADIRYINVAETKPATLYTFNADEFDAAHTEWWNGAKERPDGDVNIPLSTPVSVNYAGDPPKFTAEGGTTFYTVYPHKTSNSKMQRHKNAKDEVEPVTFDDGTKVTARLSLNGAKDDAMTKTIMFTVDDVATVKVYWECGDKGRYMALMDDAGLIVQTNDEGESTVKGKFYISNFTITEPGKYYLGGIVGNNYIYKIDTAVGKTLSDRRPDWSAVADPTIEAYSADLKTGVMTVSVNALIGPAGGDKVALTVSDISGNVVKTDASGKEGTKAVLQVTPDDSGFYDIQATFTRNTDDYGSYEPKISETIRKWFDLPLATPSILGITNNGKDQVKFSFADVYEADRYDVWFEDAKGVKVGEVTTVSKNFAYASTAALNDKTEYVGCVQAVRDNKNVKGQIDKSPIAKKSFTAKKTVEETEWLWTVTGTSAGNAAGRAQTRNGAISKWAGEAPVWHHVDKTETTKFVDEPQSSLKMDDNTVRVYSIKGSGKIVPANINNDGYSFYYSPVPTDCNYTISATIDVNDWAYSNGQDGFGLVATDRIVPLKEYVLNNSFMIASTKTQYRWNGSEITTDTTYPNVDMKLGISALARYGATPANADEINVDSAKYVEDYCTIDQTTLETSCANTKGVGYNLIGNLTEASHEFNIAKKGIYNRDTNKTGWPAGDLKALNTITNPLTRLNFKLQKTDAGYFMSYTDASGKVSTKKYYMFGKKPLSQFDQDFEYVGLFASRNADVTFSNIKLTTEKADPNYDPYSDDTMDKTYYSTIAQFISADVSNKEQYDIHFLSNWRGDLTIENETGDIIYDSTDASRGDSKVESYVYKVISTNLALGANTFTATFKPDKDYHYLYDAEHPANINNVLRSYDAVKTSITVNYRTYGEEGQTLYISPKGSSTGTGTQENPLDIYTAVKYAQPGQKLVLAGGHYKLTTPVTINRNLSGREGSRIQLIADPNAKERPVLDFSGNKTGVVVAGDYWHLKGFDVTNAGDSYKGMTVNGAYNIIEDINAYNNGNTGIELARMKGTDTKAWWPHDNLIKNCTSHDNSDYGFEDADGFAAKLTVGEGNVFDGCIAYMNADDGWDLYAKGESGQIGKVTIKNSVVYANGWCSDWAHGQPDAVRDAGNGNGFKLGGENIPGGHTLINCYSFYNKANGIESNTCPDVKVYNSVTYNNFGKNIYLYTKTAPQSGYEVQNLISFTDEQEAAYAKKFPSEFKDYDPYAADSWQLQGDQVDDPSAVKNLSTFYWNGAASRNISNDKKLLKTITDAAFKSLDFDPSTADLGRHEDGTVDMGDFLQLKDDFTVDGLEVEKMGIGGIANDVTKPEDIQNVTDGYINNAKNDADKSDTLTVPEDIKEFVKMMDNQLLVGVIKDNYYYYTGKPIAPEVVIYDANTFARVKNNNFLTKYVNNVNASANVDANKGATPATVTITGKGAYKGSFSLDYKINQVSLDRDFTENVYNEVTEKYEDVAVIITEDIIAAPCANETPNKPIPQVYFGDKKLAVNKDFTVEYFDGDKNVTETGFTKAGMYKIVVKGIGNFNGSRDIQYDYYDASSKTNIKSVKIGKIPVQNIEPINGNKPYDTAELMDGDYKLVYGTDYTVRYVNNRKIGKATAIITGMGKYAGSVEKSFTIKKAVINKNNITFEGVTPETVVDYTGERTKIQNLPGFAVYYTNDAGEKIKLRPNADYKIDPADGSGFVGKVTFAILGKGKFMGRTAVSITVNPLQLADKDGNPNPNISVSWTKNVIFNSKSSKPTIKVVHTDPKTGKKITLREGSQYRLKLINAATITTEGMEPRFIITGMAACTGKMTKDAVNGDFKFNISQRAFNDDNVKLYATDIVVAPGAEDKEIPIKTKLSVYEKLTGAIVGTNQYDAKNIEYYKADGTKIESGKIVPRDFMLTEAEVNRMYNEGITINKDITVKVKGLGKNYSDSYATTTIHVGYDINKAKFEKIGFNAKAEKFDVDNENLIYGNASFDGMVKPSNFKGKVTFILSADKTMKLTFGSDVTDDFEVERAGWNAATNIGVLSYKNNNKVGNATVVLKGKGMFAGVKTVSFAISPFDFGIMSAK